MPRARQPASNLVDLDRYPIHDLHSETGRALVAACRMQLAETGGVNLPSFVRVSPAAALTAEVLTFEPEARRKTYTRNVYFTDDNPSLPADDPHRRFWTTTSTQLADDQIPATTMIRALYEWDALAAFVAAVMGKKKLYRMADPFQALNIIYLSAGDRSAWHYDRNEFTVTLRLQASVACGEFEFMPNIRSAGNENYDQIKNVFDGCHDGLQRYERTDGTLTIFMGGNSLHRVTPIADDHQRIIAILCYDEQPDCFAPDNVNVIIYGDRIKPILAARNNIPH